MKEIPESVYQEIEQAIGSDQSVVGIDAKKTHIIIIHMLKQIQEKLESLEQRVNQLENRFNG
ncbi:MAG: hypothetical protein EA359_05960 [Balneolaceae bacterium]|nr:MAG: hypothetical protein EA359_05960 [Balneolaceae bacterium]